MFTLMILICGFGTAQAAISTNTSFPWGIDALLIVSSFLYNCSMGTLTNTLCTEIFSTLLRSKSVVLARW